LVVEFNARADPFLHPLLPALLPTLLKHSLETHTRISTVIDPQLTRGDRLVGQVLGSKGSLPSIYTEIEINYFLLRRLLGVKTDDKKQTKVSFFSMLLHAFAFLPFLLLRHCVEGREKGAAEHPR
jgi:hypothetical protein